MAVGLEVIGDSGTVLLSDTYKNFFLKSSGSITISSTPYYAALPALASDDIVFISPPAGVAALVNGIQSLGTMGIATDGPGVFEYYIFSGYSTPVSSGNFGLEVFDASGVLKYSSSAIVANIIQVAKVNNATDPTIPPPTQSFTINSPRSKMAIAVIGPRFTIQGAGMGGTPIPFFADGGYISGSTFGVKPVVTQRNPSPTTEILSSGGPTLLLVDVSS